MDASIVTSTYNRSGLLGEALDSALAQRGVKFEVIVVDNGSTDDTKDVLASYQHPALVVIRNEVSLGGTGGRNTGLARARGRYVGILDDDDVWHPDKVARQVAAMEDTGRAWSFAGCVYIDDAGHVLGGRPPPTPEQTMAELPYRFVVPGGMSNVLWRRTALDGQGLLDPALFLTVDWDLVLRLMRVGPPAVLTEPLVAYRQHRTNASRAALSFQPELDLLEAKHADLRGTTPLDRGVQHRFLASQALRGGQRRKAAVSYARALRRGDWGSALRALGLLLPLGAQQGARRRLLSDRRWLREAEHWLSSR